MVGYAERRICAETNQSNGHNLGAFDARNMNHDLITNRQEREMVAVERKGNKIGGTNYNVVREYEFFPGMKMEEKAEMMKMGSECPSWVYGGAGYYKNKQQLLTKTSFPIAANSCIDLDLKLSY